MTDTPMKKERPLSPHLQVYKPQITSMSSILHRASGAFLAIGLFLFAWGVISLAQGPETYDIFIQFIQSTIGQIALVGWSAAFFYHACTGIRHFILDSGYLYEKGVASLSGWIVILVAATMTACTWGYIYCDVLMGGM